MYMCCYNELLKQAHTIIRINKFTTEFIRNYAVQVLARLSDDLKWLKEARQKGSLDIYY